ncbi:MAG: hypothetical protein ACO3ST_00200 [Burkholderiaceae bacterium]
MYAGVVGRAGVGAALIALATTADTVAAVFILKAATGAFPTLTEESIWAVTATQADAWHIARRTR